MYQLITKTVKLSKYWRDIKFEGEEVDYEDIADGVDYENQPFTIQEAIEELRGCSEPSDNSGYPNYYSLDSEHNLDGTITMRTVHIEGTREQLKQIFEGVK